MSFLDDYNRQKTLGDMAGPPTTLGALTAQQELDAQRRVQESSRSDARGRSYTDSDAFRWLLISVAVSLGGLLFAAVSSGASVFIGILAFFVGGFFALVFGIAALVGFLKG